MKVGICDDEMCFIETIRHLIGEWSRENAVPVTIYEFTNGDDLIKAHQEQCMDLIILDVIMPLLNGIDTARELRLSDMKVPIIFLTSSREFAVESYDVRAFHYLMKPVDAAMFYKVMDRFLAECKAKKETVFVRIAGGNCNITLDEVEVLEAQNKQVVLYFVNGTTLEIKELFSECANVFTLEKGFYRCHRSYIVNMNYIEQFTKTQVITKGGVQVPISRSNYVAFKEAYFCYMFE